MLLDNLCTNLNDITDLQNNFTSLQTFVYSDIHGKT